MPRYIRWMIILSIMSMLYAITGEPTFLIFEFIALGTEAYYVIRKVRAGN